MKIDKKLIETIFQSVSAETIVEISFRFNNNNSQKKYGKEKYNNFSVPEITEIYYDLMTIIKSGGEMINIFEEDDFVYCVPLIFEGDNEWPHSPQNIYQYESEYGARPYEYTI